MYFLTPNHLACQAGYSKISLGRTTFANGGRSTGRTYMRDGQALLETGAHTVPAGDPSQRRALFEGSWLALGYNTTGDLERACDIGRTAAARLPDVKSPRSAALLEQLAADLRRKQRNPHVATFLPELEQALTKHTGPAVGRRSTVGR